MIRVGKDQLNREVRYSYPPERIISLVPSQTEFLFELGLGDKIVGITKFCIHPPESFKSTTKVGGTKNLNISKIISLKPDLIIGNKEENIKSQIDELSSQFPVWLSDVNTLSDAFSMMDDLGKLTGTEEKAGEIIDVAKRNLEHVSAISNLLKKNLSVAYLIWKDPYMLAGTSTFIDCMINFMGLSNACTESRYPETSIQKLKDMLPDLIFLSTEPYPFKEQHLAELENSFPGTPIFLVDGEAFSWYGSRLVHSSSYLENLIKKIAGNYQ